MVSGFAGVSFLFNLVSIWNGTLWVGFKVFDGCLGLATVMSSFISDLVQFCTKVQKAPAHVGLIGLHVKNCAQEIRKEKNKKINR